MSDQTGGRNIAEYDWLIDYTKDGDLKYPLLHAPNTVMVAHYESWWEDGLNYGEEYGAAPALCGEVGEWSIPGAGSRMSIRRCPRCCEISGLPDGVGSPKNDAACRELLSMAPSARMNGSQTDEKPIRGVWVAEVSGTDRRTP